MLLLHTSSEFFWKKHDLNVSATALNRTLRLAPTKRVVFAGYPPATPCGIHLQPVTSAVGALSVPAVIAATIVIYAIAFLAVPANVAVSMTGVGLKAASLKAAAFWGSAGGGGNADKVARAATAAARIGAEALEARTPATRIPLRDRLIDGRMTIFPSLSSEFAATVNQTVSAATTDRTVACETTIAEQIARRGIVTFEGTAQFGVKILSETHDIG